MISLVLWANSGALALTNMFFVVKVVERRQEIDWRRNAAFASFGFLYLGGVQVSELQSHV